MHYIVFLFFLLQPNRVYAAQGAQESCMIVSHPKSWGFRVITFSIQDSQLVFDLRKTYLRAPQRNMFKLFFLFGGVHT